MLTVIELSNFTFFSEVLQSSTMVMMGNNPPSTTPTTNCQHTTSWCVRLDTTPPPQLRPSAHISLPSVNASVVCCHCSRCCRAAHDRHWQQRTGCCSCCWRSNCPACQPPVWLSKLLPGCCCTPPCLCLHCWLARQAHSCWLPSCCCCMSGPAVQHSLCHPAAAAAQCLHGGWWLYLG